MTDERLKDLSNIAGRRRGRVDLGGGAKKELTPNGVLMAALLTAYDGCCPPEKLADADRFGAFMQTLLRGLAELATQGKVPDLFGTSLNDFVGQYVKLANACGKMHRALKEHGIEVDLDGGEDR